jgi:hypothetical protein
MKKNNITLSELRNIIKEEIQSQLTKKNLVESVNKKSKKSILKEESVIKHTQNFNVTAVSVEAFVITDNNPQDEIVITNAQLPAGKMKIEFIYTLSTETDNPINGKFFQMRKDFPALFFSSDVTSLNIFDQQKVKDNLISKGLTELKETPFSYRLTLSVTKNPNLTVNTENFKGTKPV